MIFEKNDRIVFIGDSVTDAGRSYPVGERAEGLGNGFVRTIDSFLSAFYPELNLRITNTGVSGNTIRTMKERWQTDLLDLNPDWVVVMIGVNDVWRQMDSPTIPDSHVYPEEYETTYRELIEKTKERVKGIILVTPYYMENVKEDRMRKRLDEYGAIVKKLGTEYGLTVVDTQARFDEYLQYRYSATLNWDRVHPDPTGCLMIATEILKAAGFDKQIF